jgi:dihydropyrimidine dehydrogenase (NAD+) subunit PreA
MAGELDERTKRAVSPTYANWTTHPNNPMAKTAEPRVPEPAE